MVKGVKLEVFKVYNYMYNSEIYDCDNISCGLCAVTLDVLKTWVKRSESIFKGLSVSSILLFGQHTGLPV